MALPVYIPPSRVITIQGNDVLVVRGLGFDDITLLVQAHLAEITAAVEKYRDSLGEIYTTRSMDDFLMMVLTGFPGLAAKVIAIAADAPDDADTVRGYPVGVTTKALLAIVEMTLQDMGDLSDPSPALASLVRRLSGAITQRMNASLASIGRSDETSAA